MHKIECGDVFDVLRNYPDNYFTGCLTDPPYELGYMGRKWDSTGIAFNTSFWKEVYRVLAPGSYLLAFGFPRTHHRLMVALEDAEFELRDMLMWVYASGFPKAKSCLKPSWEPIVLAYKPGKKQTPLNIDECRIGDEVRWNKTANNVKGSGWGMRPTYESGRQAGTTVVGRWPGNVAFEQGVDEQLSRYFFCAKAGQAEKTAGLADKNTHPTVKPLALCKWLATLIQPPQPDSLFVPFSGSGSEMIGGLQAGWSEVIGVELEPEYAKLAETRIAHWLAPEAEIAPQR